MFAWQIKASSLVTVNLSNRGSVMHWQRNRTWTWKHLINMIDEVHHWERVDELPELWEWYRMELHVMDKLCRVHLIIGRKLDNRHVGYVKIIEKA